MSDMISRQAAINALDKCFDNIPIEQTTEILKLRKTLRELPAEELACDGCKYDRNDKVHLHCVDCKRLADDNWTAEEDEE